MASGDRIPCINPRCRRTAPYEPNTEIICGKCFRALPDDLKREHRRCWREKRKFERRITRTSDELKIQRLRAIADVWSRKINENWEKIRAAVEQPDKPDGLQSFLEENGLS